MRLLLITNLYPGPDSADTTTVALHSYAQYWRHHAEVLVVRPKYLSLRSPRSWRSWRLTGQCYCHDSVAAVAFPFINRMLLAQFSIHAVAAYLRRHDFLPDVVVTHMVPNLRWGAILARKFGAKLVVGIHGSDVYRWNRHSGRIAAQADLVAFRSSAIERQFATTYGASLVRRRVLAPSGINPALIIGPGDRAWPSASNRPFTFVVAAKLLKLKNIDCTLVALAGMRDSSWRLVIAGDGPEGPRLRALSEHLDLADRISFLGRLPHHQVLALFDQAEVLVMVSAPETFGLAYLEAMARGCVVVGARGWGVDGIVMDGHNGYLCEPRNVAELTARLRDLCDAGAGRLATVAEAARRTVSGFDEQKLADQYLAAINACRQA